MLILASMMMNVGEVATLRTSTANAADAAALAGASWVASGENEMTDMADAMVDNAYLIQRIYATPFCPNITLEQIATFYWAAQAANQSLAAFANGTIIEQAWQQGRAYAYFTALSQATIDDPTGQAQQHIQDQAEAFSASAQLPASQSLAWNRGGAGGAGTEASTLTVNVTFPSQRPKLRLQNWTPLAKQWQGPQGDYSGTRVGWTVVTGTENWTLVSTEYSRLSTVGPGTVKAFEGYPYERKAWGTLRFDWTDIFPDGVLGGPKNIGIDALPIPNPSPTDPQTCPVKCVPESVLQCHDPNGASEQCCFPTPVPINYSEKFGSAQAIPVMDANQDHANGEVSVEVVHARQGGTQLAFWTMRYPAPIRSTARARYEGASVNTTILSDGNLAPPSTGQTTTAARAFLHDVN